MEQRGGYEPPSIILTTYYNYLCTFVITFTFRVFSIKLPKHFKSICEWWDSNPQGRNDREILSLVCIPIPPHSRFITI